MKAIHTYAILLRSDGGAEAGDKPLQSLQLIQAISFGHALDKAKERAKGWNSNRVAGRTDWWRAHVVEATLYARQPLNVIIEEID